MSENKMTDAEIVKWILACRDEAAEAKRDRMNRNKGNYDAFHLRHDFSHKEEGQSTEVLSKQAMAVEQIKSFFQQALADLGDWWKAEACYADAEESMLIRPHEITKLTNYMLERATYFTHVGNSIESALLGALVISKTHGCMKAKPKYVARKKGRGKALKRWIEKTDDKTWEMKFDIVRQENFYPDPTGKKLYEIEDSWPDFHEALYLAESDDDFDVALLKSISRANMVDVEENAGKARETGQNPSVPGHRVQPKWTEFWGTILHPTSGEVVFENVQAVVINDTDLILRPRPNPNWNQKSPYTVSPLIEVANSVWHKALMDAPTCHENALTEMYNLLVDAGMMEVHGIKQLRMNDLSNPAQVANGVKAGTTLMVKSTLSPGTKVMEPLTTVTIPAEAFSIFNIMAQEFNASALTNDLRQGVMPFRAVKATEVVEASQTITSVFQGMAKNYEARQSTPELALAWETTAQNWDLIDREVFISLFGAQRGAELADLPPEEVFAATVNGVRFRVYGITLTLSKAEDFRKITTLLQTIVASPPLLEAYVAKYDISKTLAEIMTSLNIDKHKLEIPKAEQDTVGAATPPVEQGTDEMSQVPSAASGSLADIFGGGVEQGLPQSSFPGSPATAGGQ